ncbi:MAG: hypothetical protein BWY93_01959 [Euryarchaeota archaeon ADurb.BinA087]|nr:MAG: hypothetical protein BWY93_01959 [Euryarchaeota archaeon ADurb.BinA087]
MKSNQLLLRLENQSIIIDNLDDETHVGSVVLILEVDEEVFCCQTGIIVRDDKTLPCGQNLVKDRIHLCVGLEGLVSYLPFCRSEYPKIADVGAPLTD